MPAQERQAPAWQTDTEFTEETLTSVDKTDASYGLGFGSSGMCIEDPGFEPTVGQTVRLYGKGFGWPVRGVVIDGQVAYYRTPDEEQARREEESRLYQEKRRLQKLEPKLPIPQIPGFEWTEDMHEISGFGGGYERECRKMVSQGCRWLAEHPEVGPQFHGFKGVYGVIAEDNDDAKALSAAILDGCDGASGAMHQASVGHALVCRRLGSWAAYQGEMRKPRNDEETA